MVGLNGCMDRASSALSGGMRRRLSLAIALIGNPRIVTYVLPVHDKLRYFWMSQHLVWIPQAGDRWYNIFVPVKVGSGRSWTNISREKQLS